MSSQSCTAGFDEFVQRFPNEEAAREYFERNRWAGETSCFHCGSLSVAPVKNMKPMPWRCRDCRQHFSVRTGTVLAESRLPLHKWLMAIYLMTTARKCIPSTQMARELGVTQKSAWFLAQRIRQTWLGDSDDADLGNRVHVHKIHMGDSEKNKHWSKKLDTSRGTVGKVAVIGICGGSTVKAVAISDTHAATLQGFVRDNFSAGYTVVTGCYVSYVGLEMQACKHIRGNNSIGDYLRNMADPDGIKSFWALLKRGHYTILHYMSAKRLYRYLNDPSFITTLREQEGWHLSNAIIGRMLGKRLTDKELIIAQGN